MKNSKKFRYPKLSIFILAIILAYVVFTSPSLAEPIKKLEKLGYSGFFIAGALYAFGFTSPFAVGIFSILQSNNLIVSAVIGGIGALFSDMLIFGLVKISFMDEFRELEKTFIIEKINKLISRVLPAGIKKTLLYALAGVVIASPLPDEIGVSLLAGFTKINKKEFTIISFLLNTLGILIILLLASYLSH